MESAKEGGLSPQEGDVKKKENKNTKEGEKVAPVKARFRVSLTKNFFFGSRVFGFWDTHLVWILAPTRLSLRGSHVRRKFRKWTNLRSESSTFIGLLYADWRSRCEVFVARNAALCERESCLLTSNNQPLFTSWRSSGDFLLGLYCVAWLAQESVSLRIFVRKKGMSHVPLNGRAKQTPSARFGKEKTCL